VQRLRCVWCLVDIEVRSAKAEVCVVFSGYRSEHAKDEVCVVSIRHVTL
jgi:hypothetical protein